MIGSMNSELSFHQHFTRIYLFLAIDFNYTSPKGIISLRFKAYFYSLYLISPFITLSHKILFNHLIN